MKLNILQYCSCCVTSHMCQRVNTGDSYIFYFGYLYAVGQECGVQIPGIQFLLFENLSIPEHPFCLLRHISFRKLTESKLIYGTKLVKRRTCIRRVKLNVPSSQCRLDYTAVDPSENAYPEPELALTGVT